MVVIKKTLQENYIFFIKELARINKEIEALPRGGISAKRIGSSIYYYHQWREGRKVKSVSLGRDFPHKLADGINRRRTLETQKSEILQNINVIAKAIDSQRVTVEEILRLFYQHGIKATLIGSYCLPFYRDRWNMGLPTIKTQDVDFLITVPYKGKNVDMETLLVPLGFSIGFHPDGSTYFTNGMFRIDFLTPERGKGIDKAIHIKELKVNATPLRYLQMLCDRQLSLQLEDYRVSMPEPWVFAYHKIIITRAKRASGKKEKDLLQATSILKEIAKRPHELRDAREYLKTLPAPWVKYIRGKIADKVPEIRM